MLIPNAFVNAQEVPPLEKLSKKIEQSDGDQRIVYEYICLRKLSNYFKNELPAYQKKFISKNDEKHIKLFELIELAFKENTPEKLQEIRQFSEDNRSISVVYAFGKFYEMKVLDKLDMEKEVISCGEKNLWLFKKYDIFPLTEVYSMMGIEV